MAGERFKIKVSTPHKLERILEIEKLKNAKKFFNYLPSVSIQTAQNLANNMALCFQTGNTCVRHVITNTLILCDS